MDAVIRVENLTHTYSVGTPFEKTAINNINVDFHAGELVAVIGHTGSGKSTFMQHMNGLLAPEYQLFEETVYKDIAFGPKNMKLSESEIDERVREAAGFVGVGEELFERSPLELSGGQKRRIAIAGVMVTHPAVVLADEPTAGLDPGGCAGIIRNILDYREQTGSTVLLVTHSMDDAARIADRLVVFHEGSIAMDGTPSQVFSRPAELTAMGLDVPQAAAIAQALRERGVELPASIYTLEQLEAALVPLRKGGAD